jgi:hypothetical protein
MGFQGLIVWKLVQMGESTIISGAYIYGALDWYLR